ncbi:MAG: CsgE family curli-type amyloid fiber assembly protein [Bacteroidota bacterium]
MNRRMLLITLLLIFKLVAVGGILIAYSQNVPPSAADSLAKQNDLVQRAVWAIKDQSERSEKGLASPRAARDPQTEIDGLIISQTLTKIGVDFYELFYQRWSAPPTASGYEVRIEELPAPGFGTLVVVKVNETTVFQRVLQPRYDQLEASADLAVSLTQRHVNDQQRLTQQLYEEDQQGTGIY